MVSLIALSQRIMVEAKTKTTRHAVNQGLDPQIAVDLDWDLQVTCTNCQRIKEFQSHLMVCERATNICLKMNLIMCLQAAGKMTEVMAPS